MPTQPLDPRRPLRQPVCAAIAVHPGGEAVTSPATPRIGTPPPPQPPGSTATRVRLRINGAAHELMLDPRMSLLDALRERLQLTGTKKGCNQGACGACTVLVDGERVNACLTLAVQLDGCEVTTVEGLAPDDELHPLQAAFITHDGFQCGYCTPGQLCSAVGMVREFRAGLPSAVTGDVSLSTPIFSDEEIRERMSGNLCRCGAYNGIVDAIHASFDAEVQP